MVFNDTTTKQGIVQTLCRECHQKTETYKKHYAI